MSDTAEIKLKIESWAEAPYLELDDGRKFTRAEVVVTGPDDGLSGHFDALMYYRPDGTTTYVTFMHLIGTLDGRAGSFVLQGQGTFDGTTARVESAVVDGSGTGDLTGISGAGESTSTHTDYPFMPVTLTYTVR